MGGVDLFTDFPRPEIPFAAVVIFTSQSCISPSSILNLSCERPTILCFTWILLAESGNRNSMFVSVFFLIALFSEIVGAVVGFGSSVFFVPLAGLFFDFHTVLALTSILYVFSNAAKLVLSEGMCDGDYSYCSGS
jgi:hypothetical protein